MTAFWSTWESTATGFSSTPFWSRLINSLYT